MIKGRVQYRNPLTNRWVKIDFYTGRIISHKKTPGPYKGIRKWLTEVRRNETRVKREPKP